MPLQETNQQQGGVVMPDIYLYNMPDCMSSLKKERHLHFPDERRTQSRHSGVGITEVKRRHITSFLRWRIICTLAFGSAGLNMKNQHCVINNYLQSFRGTTTARKRELVCITTGGSHYPKKSLPRFLKRWEVFLGGFFLVLNGGHHFWQGNILL